MFDVKGVDIKIEILLAADFNAIKDRRNLISDGNASHSYFRPKQTKIPRNFRAKISETHSSPEIFIYVFNPCDGGSPYPGFNLPTIQ